MNKALCRFCDGVTQHVASRVILRRHKVKYFACTACGSQQTEAPTWLKEAYSLPGLHIDVGAPSRTVKNWLAVTVLLDRMNLPRTAKGVDFGAGTGLFTGLMRSVGRDFKSFDAFQPPHFSSDYSVHSIADTRPDIITAFEVFEHLPKPLRTLSGLLSLGASVIIFTTWFNDGHDSDWVYYIPDSGQHVFFFKETAIREFATSFGYEMVGSQYFYILYAPSRLSSAAREALYNFCRHAPAAVDAEVRSIIGSVINGNQYLDRDFEEANVRLAQRLEASSFARSVRFGPPHHATRALSRFARRIYSFPRRFLRKLRS